MVYVKYGIIYKKFQKMSIMCSSNLLRLEPFLGIIWTQIGMKFDLK
jgi:hypothetical protein